MAEEPDTTQDSTQGDEQEQRIPPEEWIQHPEWDYADLDREVIDPKTLTGEAKKQYDEYVAANPEDEEPPPEQEQKPPTSE